MERRRDGTPPDSIIVALFQYVLAEARSRWKAIRQIQVGLGSPYTLRTPSLEVVRRLHDRDANIQPYNNNFLERGDLLIGIDIDAASTDNQYQARAWIIFDSPESLREFRSAALSIVALDNSKTSGERSIRIRPSAKGNGWVEDASLAIFHNRATLLCPLPEDTLLIHPTRDALLTIFPKENKGFYLGRWDRKTKTFTERFLTSASIFRNAASALIAPMHISGTATLSLAPGERYLSWMEQPRADNDDVLFRRALDVRKFHPQVLIPLPKDVIRRCPVWLNEDEWIDVVNKTDIIQQPKRPLVEWYVFHRRTGYVQQINLQKPPEMAVFPLAYNSRTRDIIGEAFIPGTGILYPALVNRDTGIVRLLSPDRTVLKNSLQASATLLARPDGEEYLWSFWSTHNNPYSVGYWGGLFMDLSFWRCDARGTKAQLSFIGEVKQPDYNVTEQMPMDVLFDINGDVLLRYKGALWVVRSIAR